MAEYLIEETSEPQKESSYRVLEAEKTKRFARAVESCRSSIRSSFEGENRQGDILAAINVASEDRNAIELLG